MKTQCLWTQALSLAQMQREERHGGEIELGNQRQLDGGDAVTREIKLQYENGEVENKQPSSGRSWQQSARTHVVAKEQLR